MAKKLLKDFHPSVVAKLGSRSAAAAIYSEMVFQSTKNQKASGEFSCTTSAAWLAEKLNCTPCCILGNLKKLKGIGFIFSQRSKKFTKVYKGYVCDLKVIPLILSDFDSQITNSLNQITNSLNETKESLNQIKENDSDTAENKGSHSLARETIKEIIKETIKKEIYIKEKKSVDLTPEKKSEKSREDLEKEFDEWWDVFPKGSGWSKHSESQAAFFAIFNSKTEPEISFEDLLASTKRFAKTVATRIANATTDKQRTFHRDSVPAAARWLKEKRWKDEQVQPMVENLPPEGEKSLHPRFENFQSHGLNSNHSWAFKNIEVEEKPEEVVILTPNGYHKEILLSYLCDLERFFKKVVQVAIAPPPAGWLEIRS